MLSEDIENEETDEQKDQKEESSSTAAEAPSEATDNVKPAEPGTSDDKAAETSKPAPAKQVIYGSVNSIARFSAFTVVVCFHVSCRLVICLCCDMLNL